MKEQETCSKVTYVTPTVDLVTLRQDVLTASNDEAKDYNMGWFFQEQ